MTNYWLLENFADYSFDSSIRNLAMAGLWRHVPILNDDPNGSN